MSESQDLNVVLLTGDLTTRGSHVYTLRLARGLTGHRVRARTLCHRSRQLPESIREELDIEEVPYLCSSLLGGLAIDRIAKSCEDTRPDLLHIQTHDMARLGADLAREMHLPYVLTVHQIYHPNQSLPLQRQWIRKVIAVSNAVRDSLLDSTWLPAQLVEVIPSGVEFPPEPPTPRSSAVRSRVPVIGVIAPLEPIKGHHIFIEAARQLLDAGLECQFLIAGSGPEENRLRAYTRKLRLSGHVTFFTDLADNSQALDAIDVFCLPSLEQGLGTVMLEAMGRGIPVIATRSGGVTSAVEDGVTGLLAAPGSADELAERMRDMLTKPDWAIEMAQHAAEEVRIEFSVDRMVERTALLYRQVLDRHLAVVG